MQVIKSSLIILKVEIKHNFVDECSYLLEIKRIISKTSNQNTIDQELRDYR